MMFSAGNLGAAAAPSWPSPKISAAQPPTTCGSSTATQSRSARPSRSASPMRRELPRVASTTPSATAWPWTATTGDGIADLVLGATRSFNLNERRGVYLFDGATLVAGQDLTEDDALITVGHNTGADAGAAVGFFPDLDGDGTEELWRRPQALAHSARVGVFLGGITIPTDLDYNVFDQALTIEGLDEDGRFGEQVVPSATSATMDGPRSRSRLQVRQRSRQGVRVRRRLRGRGLHHGHLHASTARHRGCSLGDRQSGRRTAPHDPGAGGRPRRRWLRRPGLGSEAAGTGDGQVYVAQRPLTASSAARLRLVFALVHHHDVQLVV